jgi:bifunctional non-homologous end joining protein LigD
VPVYIYLFDVLWADGHDVRSRPLLERKDVLRDLLSFGGALRYAEHRDKDGEAYYREACQLGWEGLIAKRSDSPYRAGRQRDWLKFKCLNGQEFVVGGYTDPQRSRVGFGALLLGYYGPWTPDGELRHPRFQGLRRDKNPAEVVRETPTPEHP